MLTPSMKKKLLMFLLVEEILHQQFILTCILIILITRRNRNVRRRTVTWGMISRIPRQVLHLNRLVHTRDSDCVANLRMDRNAFAHLCYLLNELGGLKRRKYVGVEEQVSVFLSVLAHHKKNRVVAFDFERSGQTISTIVRLVLKAVLKLHHLFLVKPVPVSDDSTDSRWKWFKGCLGALDGTFIDLHVPCEDRARYRTRKGRVSTNVLGVCDTQMRFVYVLPGWEGSAADCRILRDAVSRPHGLKVPKGKYYLCDNGYPNSEGFLVPYRNCRYHLSEWGPNTGRPTNPHEHYNMRHTRARNIIERAFGVLKRRFGILRSTSFYPTKVQVRLIMACFLLHNYCRSQMPVDPIEEMFDLHDDVPADDEMNDDVVDTVESSVQFNDWRENLAQEMWDHWRSGEDI